MMEFLQVDVFTDTPYEGNPLAVLPEASELSASQMQAIAREMNLSETTFVTEAAGDSYSLRIFTPGIELPFAGHPTLGTAWALLYLNRISGDEFTQRSEVGKTRVFKNNEELWFERSGEVGNDLEQRDPDSTRRLDRALGLQSGQVGMEARELGRSGMLRPAYASAGVETLIVPVRDNVALKACRPRPHLLEEFGDGVYCFTAIQAGRISARGFFPGTGISEDPATGSAAATLGLYLADRVGAIRFELYQGFEMGRPSRMLINAEPSVVQVGGRCTLVLRGQLDRLPG
jgi:trans-2,3-dihydro-3-hydroxyanthranilate isomerase